MFFSLSFSFSPLPLFFFFLFISTVDGGTRLPGPLWNEVRGHKVCEGLRSRNSKVSLVEVLQCSYLPTYYVPSVLPTIYASVDLLRSPPLLSAPTVHYPYLLTYTQTPSPQLISKLQTSNLQSAPLSPPNPEDCECTASSFGIVFSYVNPSSNHFTRKSGLRGY
ncbi:hypothetical protein F4775DRAFT_548525 [Biscogniauxia sp. FL1348]|nr:hypothetical protein F4775DRAFT_548525 [Biscogniauxia sp. FL1348]